MNKLFIATISAFLILWLIPSCATTGLNEGSQNEISNTADLSSPVGISLFPLELIPPSLGVKFYRDGIVFLSDSKNEEKISSGHISFGTAMAYYAPFGDSTLGPHINFSPKDPFLYPCDALSFSNDFGTMYFTKPSGKDKKEKIFKAENFMIGDLKQLWTYSSEPLEFCKEGSVYTHPAVSVDGSIMIFSSNNPQSTGEMDLFISRNEDMKWSEPENLGKIINSDGNEIFPILDRNNNLFFASNGLQGNGGYDIFICKYTKKGWYTPVKLSNLINSKNDEFAFAIDRLAGKSAFFTSRKTSRNAIPQLYSINLNEKIPVNANTDLSAHLYDLSAAGIDINEIGIAYNLIDLEKIRADKIKSDSIEAVKLNAQRLETERIRLAKMKADSIGTVKQNAERLKAERLRAEKLRADSISAAKLTAERLKMDKLKADKLRSDSINSSAKLTAQRIEAERLRVAKMKSDSIAAAKLSTKRVDAERLRVAKMKSDSIAAAKLTAGRLEAERLRVARLRADSLEAVRLEAARKANPDIITYKVQFISTTKPKGKFKITVDGVVYNAIEYYYLNEYRYTVGEFSTLDPAKELQYGCRRSGYPQAFVVAFRNGKRSLDMGLFK